MLLTVGLIIGFIIGGIVIGIVIRMITKSQYEERIDNLILKNKGNETVARRWKEEYLKEKRRQDRYNRRSKDET